VGIFLHRHPLHDAPLARRGTRVQSGQAVGLLHIGVLLLPVPAPVAGVVGDALAPHGAMVGFGSDLVILHPLAEDTPSTPQRAPRDEKNGGASGEPQYRAPWPPFSREADP